MTLSRGERAPPARRRGERAATLLVCLCLAACAGAKPRSAQPQSTATSAAREPTPAPSVALARTAQSAAVAEPSAAAPAQAPAPSAADATARPCVAAAAKPKRRHRLVKKPPSSEALPSPRSADAAALPSEEVNAQVGELGSSVTSILGKKVQSPKGEDLGRVVDVLADENGRVRVAIIDFGGFLGVGTRRIAVDWPLLHFAPSAEDQSTLTLGVSREKLQSAPEFKDAQRPRVLLPGPISATTTTTTSAATSAK